MSISGRPTDRYPAKIRPVTTQSSGSTVLAETTPAEQNTHPCPPDWSAVRFVITYLPKRIIKSVPSAQPFQKSRLRHRRK